MRSLLPALLFTTGFMACSGHSALPYDGVMRVDDPRTGRIAVYGASKSEKCPTAKEGEEPASDVETEDVPTIAILGPFDAGKTFLANRWLAAADGTPQGLPSGVQFTTAGVSYISLNGRSAIDLAGSGQTAASHSALREMETEANLLITTVAHLDALPVIVVSKLDDPTRLYIINTIERIIQIRRRNMDKETVEIFVVVNDRSTTNAEVLVSEIAAQHPLQHEHKSFPIPPPRGSVPANMDANVKKALETAGKKFTFNFQTARMQHVVLSVYTLSQIGGSNDEMGNALLKHLLHGMEGATGTRLMNVKTLESQISGALAKSLAFVYADVDKVVLTRKCIEEHLSTSIGCAKVRDDSSIFRHAPAAVSKLINWLKTTAGVAAANEESAHHYSHEYGVEFLDTEKALIADPQMAARSMPYSLTMMNGELQMQFEIPGCSYSNMAFDITGQGFIRVSCHQAARPSHRKPIIENSYMYGPSEYEVVHHVTSDDYPKWCRESTVFDSGLVSLFFVDSLSTCENRIAGKGLMVDMAASVGKIKYSPVAGGCQVTDVETEDEPTIAILGPFDAGMSYFSNRWLAADDGTPRGLPSGVQFTTAGVDGSQLTEEANRDLGEDISESDDV